MRSKILIIFIGVISAVGISMLVGLFLGVVASLTMTFWHWATHV